MRRTRYLLCVWAAGTLVVQGCHSPVAGTQVAPPPTPGSDGSAAAVPGVAAATGQGGRATIEIDDHTPDGKLDVQLPDVRTPAAPVAIDMLSPDATAALLAHMEPPPVIDNRGAPPLRAPSQPPPRGETSAIAFVVPAGKPVTDAPPAPAAPPVRPLTAPAITPQGNIAAESEIRVRFDEAMVPVAAVGTAAIAPVSIAPAVPGSWRWIDTRVLQFNAAGTRLPQATAFTVTVPAGTRALSGDALAAPAEQQFATPPVALAGTYPTTPLRPDSAIAIKLDQDIDPAAIAKLLVIDDATSKTKTPRPIPFHVVDLADAERRWKANPSLAYDATTMRAKLGQHVVLVAPDGAWPAGLQGRITLATGAPSREGARLSEKPSFARFDVAPEFRVQGVECGEHQAVRMSGAVCPARGYLSITLSNPIERATYRAANIQVEGEEFDDNQPSGNVVGLIAPKPVGRAYKIPVRGDLVDIYAQPLLGARTITFTTGPEHFEPVLIASTGLDVLDPRFEIPQWVIAAQAVTTLRVQLYRVQPADYFAYEEYESSTRGTPPGKLISDQTIAVGPRHGVDARIDLRPALNAAGLGHVIAVATVVPASPQPPGYFTPRAATWFQVTKLGLAARVDGDRARAWVRDISPASFLAPTAGASATIITDDHDTSAAATTDAEGQAQLALLPAKPPKPVTTGSRQIGHDTTALLAVTTATDSTFAAIAGDGHQAVRERDALWYATDDRFTYKPGETVYVKGWVRWTTNGINPDLELPASSDAITYALRDAQGNKIASGTATVTDQGGFDLAVAIPTNVNLGTADFVFTTRGHVHDLPIAIEEFRTPAFSVSLNDDVTHAGATPLILGEKLEMRAEAKYYAGGGLPGAGIHWRATLRPTTFQPAGWDLFDFSRPRERTARRSYYRSTPPGIEVVQEGALTGASTAGAVFGIVALPAAWPSILSVDATVSDVDRMAIRASSRPILVHPSEYYVGVRLDGDDDALDVVVTDIDGAPVAGVPIAVDIEAVLGSERDRNDAKVTDTQKCALTSAAAPVKCTWHRGDIQWAYTATAHIADRRGRANATEYEIPWWAWNGNQPLRLTPDRASYKPGDVAKLALVSDEVPATAIVSFARNGVIAQKRIELTAATTTIELPIEPAFVSNVHVLVDRIGKRRNTEKGSTLPLPERVSTSVELPVALDSARLVMTAKPTQKIIEPGAQATFDVEVRHGDKPAANAEVALMVVDEAVLALSSRTYADPLPGFYRALGDGTSELSTFDLVRDQGDELAGVPGIVRFSLDTRGIGSGTGSGYGYGSGLGGISTIGHGAGMGIVESRKDFRANAVFSPRLHTDANGRVSVTVKMPDSLTRFRIVAIATQSTRFFGKAEGTVITQRKINARTVAPRFLTQGDAFSLPIVVQNLDSAARTVDVAVRPVNLVSAGPAGKRVTIGPGQRAEVRFDFRTAGRGKAAVQTIAISGDFADASTVQLPVYEPATTEAFATYGVVDDAPKTEQLHVPDDVFPDVGGVEVEVASTQLQSLTDAFSYLYAYPYECAEQRSARMLATSAMADVLDAFATPGRPTRADLEATLAHDLKVLAKDQVPDGGWGYWPESPSDPYVTQQVLQAIAARGVIGSEKVRAVAYVAKDAAAAMQAIDKRLAAPGKARDPRESAGYLVSMAAADLSALAAAGVEVRPRVLHLDAAASALGEYPIDAKARLLALIAGHAGDEKVRGKLLSELLSATHETASSATVTASFGEAERMLLVSNTKSTALALDAIMREAPANALVGKLARGLLDARRRGRWTSTAENLAVLTVMRRYFDTYEKATPAYTGKLWLGGAGYAERAFAGHTTERASATVGWPLLATGSTQDLAFAKEGTGRMYYRVGITYAPKKVDLPALDAGFLVRRTYTAVDDPKDVTRDAAGRWHIKLGARVLVTLEALNTTRRYDVALVDPMPAGLEPVNTRLAIAERDVAGATSRGWDHVNMRDERAEAFVGSLREGSHIFAYSARATTPGTFVAAPAKAEEMYSPETFGRSTGVVVVVE